MFIDPAKEKTSVVNLISLKKAEKKLGGLADRYKFEKDQKKLVKKATDSVTVFTKLAEKKKHDEAKCKKACANAKATLMTASKLKLEGDISKTWPFEVFSYVKKLDHFLAIKPQPQAAKKAGNVDAGKKALTSLDLEKKWSKIKKSMEKQLAAEVKKLKNENKKSKLYSKEQLKKENKPLDDAELALKALYKKFKLGLSPTLKAWGESKSDDDFKKYASKSKKIVKLYHDMVGQSRKEFIKSGIRKEVRPDLTLNAMLSKIDQGMDKAIKVYAKA